MKSNGSATIAGSDDEPMSLEARDVIRGRRVADADAIPDFMEGGGVTLTGDGGPYERQDLELAIGGRPFGSFKGRHAATVYQSCAMDG